MIDEGIYDGDFVIVRQQQTADPGEIVVALLGEEVTVKRLRKDGKSLFLEAANAAYAPIPLTQQTPSPRILGVVVGVYHDRRRRRLARRGDTSYLYLLGGVVMLMAR